MDTSHVVHQQPAAVTEPEDTVRLQPASGFLGELAGKLGKRPKEEVQPQTADSNNDVMVAL